MSMGVAPRHILPHRMRLVTLFRRKSRASPSEERPREERRPIRPLPFARRRLSLSIDGTSLRLLLSYQKEVIDWLNLPFNPQLLREGVISDPEGMAQVIQNALQERRIRERKVKAALPNLNVLSRLLTLPPGRDVRPAEVIPREARRLMSLRLEENYLFWKKLAGPGYEQRFLVLAVPRPLLHSLLETLRLARLHPTSIELSSLCLARAVNRSTAIILHAEPNLIGAVILVENVPVLMRSSFLTGEFLLPGASASRVVQELAQNLSFYEGAHPEKPLPPDVPVYLCGSLAADPELAQMIEETISRPVSQPELILKSPPHFPAAQFMVNVGLTLSEP